MMYIGTSLGGCLRSILSGEVSFDQVMFIVTRTNAPTYDRYMQVVEQYYKSGNPYVRNSDRYELYDYSWESVSELANKLWYSGKIHQPRTFTRESGTSYEHPVSYGDGLWMEVVPTNTNSTPAVVEAYNKYRMLDALTNDTRV